MKLFRWAAWGGKQARLPLRGRLVGEVAERAVCSLDSVLCLHKPLCADGTREDADSRIGAQLCGVL